MATIYAVANSNGPYTAHMSLALAQAAVELDQRRYSPNAEHRWDEEPGARDTRMWQLKTKGLTGRWAKVYIAIHELPLG
ncbi:hypothetical protein [Kitasatospora sp. NPDC047058]|uniref:hypothetical protein n=1 Tax=Kitasatospora sp. NPDC047058 TaxID=3155620 RepID=UPI0033EF853E